MSASRKRPGSPQVDEAPTKRPAKLVEVVPDGDVLLAVGRGDDALKIRVSGTVISLASGVFSRMLSSSFTEGRSREIELREDVPEAVLDFCNIAHHKAENVDHCDGSRLVKLVEFADARFCVKALRPWLSARLAGIIEEFKGYDRNMTPMNHNWISPEDDSLELTMEQCMSVAAVFKLNDLFWFATKHFLLLQGRRSTSPTLPSFAESALGSRVHSFKERFEKESMLQSRQFFDGILECVGRDFDAGAVDASAMETRSCSFAKFSAIMFYLAKKGIKPGEDWAYKKSISRAMLDVQSLCITEPWSTVLERTECNASPASPCLFCRRDIVGDLLEVVEWYMKETCGACLLCYNSGSEDYFHATHRHEGH
ncbi:hypothetical protein AYO21_10684 [Fonsecaea monophora]|uniref:BTB domain-containing protein n=1 Tax=Fonsecaea monophora TaxID=254056 RepID=A0A177EU72_9EURO|nr:hypothetical protein AYO21_10684 [Fonsecaea monophora]KAH0832503.1 hypothetical protein FOPE_01187 [Fonsecaea pedrosoi]OAG35166.1 hypothetical protein AYO21_10684 [Fonsecaea monophora]